MTLIECLSYLTAEQKKFTSYTQHNTVEQLIYVLLVPPAWQERHGSRCINLVSLMRQAGRAAVVSA